MKNPAHYCLFEKKFGSFGILSPLIKTSRLLAFCMLVVSA